MKKTVFVRALTPALCILLLVCTLGLSGCGAQETPLLTLDGQTISVNHFELLLSRVKGMNSQFNQWSSVTDLQTGTTYDEMTRRAELENAKLTLAALVLFEQEGLTLPADTYDKIDQKIQDFINADADGSKSTFNGVLSAFGINMDILRDIYIKEAKATYVKNYLFGEDKLTDGVRGEFLEDNAAAFKQITVRAWEYVYLTDENGDIIYYKTNENNARVNNIAYDKTNGYLRPIDTIDGNDKPIFETDHNGDSIYFVSPDSDHIAYDKENGVPAHKTGVDGQKLIRDFEQAERKDLENGLVAELLSSVKNGTMTNFEEKMNAYYDSLMDADAGAAEMAFLYTVENYYIGKNGAEMLTDLSDALREMQVGEVRLVESEAGYHIIMKYDIPRDAATNTTYAKWLEDLDDLITDQLFRTRCADMITRIVVDNDAWNTLPTMALVNANFYY